MALDPQRLIVNPFFSYVGKVGSRAYITHFAALVLCRRSLAVVLPGLDSQHWLISFVAWSSLAFALTMGLSSLTFHLIETPGQRLGKRLIARLERGKLEALESPFRDGWNPPGKAYS